MIKIAVAWLLIGSLITLMIILVDLLEDRIVFTKQNMITIAIMICLGFVTPVIFLYFLWKGWSH